MDKDETLVEPGTEKEQGLVNRLTGQGKLPRWWVTASMVAIVLCLALFPLLGVVIRGAEGLVIGTLILIGVGIPAGLGLFALIRWLVSRADQEG